MLFRDVCRRRDERIQPMRFCTAFEHDYCRYNPAGHDLSSKIIGSTVGDLLPALTQNNYGLCATGS